MSCPITITNLGGTAAPIQIDDLGFLLIPGLQTIAISDFYDLETLAKSADLVTEVINNNQARLEYKGIEITDIAQLCPLTSTDLTGGSSDRTRYLEGFILSDSNTIIDTDFFVAQNLTTFDLPFIITNESELTQISIFTGNTSAYSFDIEILKTSPGFASQAILAKTTVTNTNSVITPSNIILQPDDRIRLRFFNANNADQIAFPRIIVKLLEV